MSSTIATLARPIRARNDSSSGSRGAGAGGLADCAATIAAKSAAWSSRS